MLQLPAYSFKPEGCITRSCLTTFCYADDTNELALSKDLCKLLQTINEELHKIILRLAANKSSLNIKTHFMIFSSKQNISMSQFDININGQIIDKVPNTKFLGTVYAIILTLIAPLSHLNII